MTRAWLFPGQGSQAVGMGADLCQESAAAREIFRTADEVLGFPLSRICFEGPEEELRRTAVTQPALLTVSVAATRILEERGYRPSAVVGHSLGEYSALVAAGALTFADAVQAVHQRGQFMQDAVPEGVGAMAAVLGLEPAQVASICAAVAEGEVVSPANFNAPGQVVIAGHASAVARAVQAAKDQGARRAVPLNVSAPFHCSLMEPAARRLAPILESISFHMAAVPVWVNVDAAPVTDPGELRRALVRQVVAPVRWDDCIRGLGESGETEFLEVGVGSVLAGLVRRISKSATVEAAGTMAALRGLTPATS